MADTKCIISCPACDKEMTKVYVKEANMNVDICLDGCGGILFDNRELEKVDEAHENADEIFEAVKNKTFKPTNEQEVRLCPICNSAMVKQGCGIEGIEIDVCNTCGSKFLDHNELTNIRNLRGTHSNLEATNELVDRLIDENPVLVGGKMGEFAMKHVITIKEIVSYVLKKFKN